MRKWIVLFGIALAVGIAPLFAQSNEGDSPLLQMLARIPDSAAAREYFSYIDYQALLTSRPGMPEIRSWQDYETIIARRSSERSLLISALQGAQSGPQFFGRYLSRAGATPAVVGFDLFAIRRAVEFGNPPNQADILEGDFDTQAVITAHQQRDYTSSNLDGLTLLCPSAGCDSGTKMDLSQINEANPFGGALGRSQPVIVGDQIVASSPNIDLLNTIASTAADPSTSLAEQPDYRAAAEAISENGTLIQSYFINPTDIDSGLYALFDIRTPPTARIPATVEALRRSFVPLPQYNLVALADTVTVSEEQALVGLVYTNRATATAAAALFPDRLNDFQLWRDRQTFSTALAEHGVTSTKTAIYATSNKRFVLLISFRAPLPSSSVTEGQTAESSSRIYSLLVNTYTTDNLGWLATHFEP